MQASRRKILAGAVGATTLATFGLHQSARAQTFPTKPIRIYVGFLPGAATDISVRIAAEAMAQTLGQPIIVETKAGAGSMIAADYVAKSAPDGYTLFQCTSGGVSVLPAVEPKTPYRPESFTYICRLITASQVLALNPKLPINTMAEFIAYARANPPETLKSGTAGPGGVPDLTTALLALEIGAKIMRVPYKGSAGNINAVLSGEVDFAFLSPSTALPLAKAGRVKMIAVTSPQREKLWPDVPTMAESGLPAVTVENYFGIIGPAGMPANVVDRLRNAAVAALKNPTVIEQYKKFNIEPAPLVGDDFKKLAQREYEQWARVAKNVNIKLE
jgi:tripartite-type tricarboxylate transporter receptor subunit TctC